MLRQYSIHWIIWRVRKSLWFRKSQKRRIWYRTGCSNFGLLSKPGHLRANSAIAGCDLRKNVKVQDDTINKPECQKSARRRDSRPNLIIVKQLRRNRRQDRSIEIYPLDDIAFKGKMRNFRAELYIQRKCGTCSAYSKRGSDKAQEQIRRTVPHLYMVTFWIDKSHTDDGVHRLSPVLLETVRFLLAGQRENTFIKLFRHTRQGITRDKVNTFSRTDNDDFARLQTNPKAICQITEQIDAKLLKNFALNYWIC